MTFIEQNSKIPTPTPSPPHNNPNSQYLQRRNASQPPNRRQRNPHHMPRPPRLHLLHRLLFLPLQRLRTTRLNRGQRLIDR